jgi:hypothetical protein
MEMIVRTRVSPVRLGIIAVATALCVGALVAPARATDADSVRDTAITNSESVAAASSEGTFFTAAQKVGGADSNADFVYGLSVAVTQDGAAIITGSFQGTAYFPRSAVADDSIALTSAGSSDVFVAALNADGSYFAWATRAGGTDGDQANSVAVTADDTVIITGYFEGTAYFPTGPAADDSIALTPTGSNDVFVAALNTDSAYFAMATRAGGTVGALGESVAVTPEDTAIITGTFEGTVLFPVSATDSISLTQTGVVDTFVAWLSLATPGPAPDPPAPVVVPPSSPLNVAGEPGVASATITWSSPASPGSFPVTNYQVVVSPGGSTCLAAVPALTCTVSGLTNGTAYTASVRALNGAGWGAFSAPSSAFTPTGTVVSTVVITGSRAEVRGRSGIVLSGATTGFGTGGLLRPWVRLPGQTTFTQGRARILVDADGAFTWQRRVGKKVTVYVETPDGMLRSNRITIPRSSR